MPLGVEGGGGGLTVLRLHLPITLPGLPQPTHSRRILKKLPETSDKTLMKCTSNVCANPPELHHKNPLIVPEPPPPIVPENRPNCTKKKSLKCTKNPTEMYPKNPTNVPHKNPKLYQSPPLQFWTGYARAFFGYIL